MPLGRYLGVPILLGAALLQSTLMPEFLVRAGRADLILMLVLSWTLLAGVEEGIVWAVIGGVSQDLMIGIPLGTTALALVIVSFGVGSVAGQIGRRNLIVPPIAAAIGTLAYHVLLMFLYTVLGRSMPIVDSLLNITLPTLIINAILILPVFRILGALYALTAPRRVGSDREL